MKYANIVSGRFIDRPNRFIAHVEIDGVMETVHVKNTGRCMELLLPEADVMLAVSDSPSRKTKYDLISVYKKNLGWVNIDSQAPNVVVKEWLMSGQQVFPNITTLKPEYVHGNSRVDFYLECGQRKIFIEVKGCTLEIDGIGYFPDAPTVRGSKHLLELAGAAACGYECWIGYVVQINGIKSVQPAADIDPQFAENYRKAVSCGVGTVCFHCSVTPESLEITGSDLPEFF